MLSERKMVILIDVVWTSQKQCSISYYAGKSFEDDCNFFNPDYICNNKNEFESTIKEILASDEILNIIQMLFAKAAMISR